MKDLLNKPIDLSIEIGKGYISYDEFLNLDVDHCFTVNKNAGESFFLKANNEIIASGEVVIIENFFGFRINSLYKRTKTNELPSQINDITEFLPTEIRFDNFQSTLNELKGLSNNSIIQLDKRYDEHIDATLYVLGIPIAEGKTTTIHEKFAIHVKQLLIKKNEKTEINDLIKSSGYRYIKRLNNNIIKDYDYKRPDKFTWTFLKRMELLHQSFINNLAQSINISFDDAKVKIDQMTFAEFINELNNAEYDHYIFKQEFPALLSKKSNADIKIFLESTYIKRKLPDHIKEMIKQFNDKRFFEPKMILSIKQNNLLNNKMPGILNNALLNTWLQITNTNFMFDKYETDKKQIYIVPNNDMIMTVDILLHDDTIIKMVYPYITIEPIFSIMS